MASTINAKNTSTGVVITPDSSGQLELQTADITRMTITSSGNVGVGTSSPTNYSGFKTLAISGSTGGVIDLMSGSTVVGELFNTATDVRLQNNTANPVQIWTNGSERMRIDSSGNVLINATSLASGVLGKMYVNGIVSGAAYQCRAGGNGTWTANGFLINWTGTAQLWIDNTNVGTISLTSDYRIKKNIETNATPALERIAQVRPVTYEYANYGELFKEDGVQREGFIAHELQAVIPSAVEGEKDAEDQIQSLKLDALCSVMVKAIQELKAIVDTQAERIAVLENKIV